MRICENLCEITPSLLTAAAGLNKTSMFSHRSSQMERAEVPEKCRIERAQVDRFFRFWFSISAKNSMNFAGLSRCKLRVPSQTIRKPCRGLSPGVALSAVGAEISCRVEAPNRMS